jgi:flagellar biosynthesis/type III secretory pathway protein FliH
MSKPEDCQLSAAELAELDKLKRKLAEAERERDEVERELKQELNAYTQALYGCSHAELLNKVFLRGAELGHEQGHKQGWREGYAAAKGRKPSGKKRSERVLLINDVDQRRALGQTPKEAVERHLEVMQVGKRALAMHAEQAAKVVLDCLRAEQADEGALDSFSQAMEAGKDVFALLRAMEASKDARVLRAMGEAKRLITDIELPEQVVHVPKHIPDADVSKGVRVYYRHRRPRRPN